MTKQTEHDLLDWIASAGFSVSVRDHFLETASILDRFHITATCTTVKRQFKTRSFSKSDGLANIQQQILESIDDQL